MEIHPRVKLAALVLLIIILVAPGLGADIVHGLINAASSAIESLKAFGDAF
jgi:hypothetical protein